MNARLGLILIALPLALAGCGNKGPLVMPEPAEVVEPDTAEGAVPVDIEVPEELPADEPVGALPDSTSADPLLGDTVTTDPMPAPVDPAPDEAGADATAGDPPEDDADDGDG